MTSEKCIDSKVTEKGLLDRLGDSRGAVWGGRAEGTTAGFEG